MDTIKCGHPLAHFVYKNWVVGVFITINNKFESNFLIIAYFV